jgi:nicotinate phosphoribosyltransferase
MWLIKNTPALFTDLYELTMAQIYFQNKMQDTAYFEVTVRRLPRHWGFFVMAGLAELHSYLREFRFSKPDLDYLKSTNLFADDFLQYLSTLVPEVKIRSLPEGAVFFPNEPILEVAGPLPITQLLESYVLNILGFSIIAATLAARIIIAADGHDVVDFALRRCQGPVASIRAARAAQIADFAATSNLFAARLLNYAPAGTMAHSFVQVHEGEEDAFRSFAQTYRENAILLVDTYDSIEGIRKAAKVAKQLHKQEGVKIKGIRLDSGDLVELSKFARKHFQQQEVAFIKIFASGDLDEFKIHDLLKAGAQIDGFGIGTRFAVSRFAPAIEIVYKIVQYAGAGLFKSSPDKESRPGRKSITRIKKKFYEKDIVCPFECSADGLLKPFESPEPIETIQHRLTTELALLPASIKSIRDPTPHPMQWSGFSD